MRTKHYSNGTAITKYNTTESSYSTRCYYDPGNPTNYGLLYNWLAAKGPSSVSANNQGVCPVGWHLPSNGEWIDLTQYVGNQSQYLCSNNISYIAKALASTNGWYSATGTCVVGLTPSLNNATGFNALPAGLVTSYSTGDHFIDGGYRACFWSSIEGSGFYLHNSSAVVYNSGFGVNRGLSVRCLRD